MDSHIQNISISIVFDRGVEATVCQLLKNEGTMQYQPLMDNGFQKDCVLGCDDGGSDTNNSSESTRGPRSLITSSVR